MNIVLEPVKHDIPGESSLVQRRMWHAMDVDAISEQLDTDLATGLTTKTAQANLLRDGPNALPDGVESKWWRVLIRQFGDVLTLILVAAASMSLIVGEFIDATTIVAIVTLNGLLGFAQEWKAERAIAALKQMLSPTCSVIRDGKEQTIEARDLVAGDLVTLVTGARVPADIRIVRANGLHIDESTLTGESDSIEKSTEAVDAESPLPSMRSMAWMGTTVTAGRALGIVTATGTDSHFGRISTLTEAITAEPTSLQRKMATLGWQLGLVAIVISVVVGVVGWHFGKPLVEMFMTGISLAVAVVPEGLPAVVTLTMALGVRAMVRRRALLRRLQAAESLGATTVVCTDKTGTLTENQMTVRRIWLPTGVVDVTGVGYDPAGHFEQQGQRIDYRDRSDLLQLLQTGMECSHAKLVCNDQHRWEEMGEPTEAALVVAGYKAWLQPSSAHNEVAEFHFDSCRKRMTIVKQSGLQQVAHVKGAPEIVADRCSQILDGTLVRPMTEVDRKVVSTGVEKLAKCGLRTLALARRELPTDASITADAVESELTFLGVVGMLDPPRPEVPHAIEMAKNAGIQVIMITGDSAATATAIANSIGLDVKATIEGERLDGMPDEQLAKKLQAGAAFARTTPEHKLRIVRLLQQAGHVVAMTGDGVNDAPALKRADIGVAMGLRGTDVAKGAADMVLTDDNFSSIIGAIEEGRRQYDNIQKFVRYLLSSNAGEVIAIFVSILMRGPLILLPVQILWMNLVTDGLSAVALGLEPAEKSVMSRPPRATQAQVLDRSGMLSIALLGSYVGFATLGLFYFCLSRDDSQSAALAQTVAFTGIIVVQKMNVLNFRSLSRPTTWSSFWSNPWVLSAIVITLGLQVCAVYLPIMQRALHTVPMRWEDWGLIAVVAAPVFLLTEIWKHARTAFLSKRR